MITRQITEIELSEIHPFGPPVERPETQIGRRDGTVLTSAAGVGCMIVSNGQDVVPIGQSPCSNGIALDGQGNLLIANFCLGENQPGPLQRMSLATGETEDLVTAIDGRELVACNFVAIAPDGDIYCTHTSWGPTWDSCVDPTCTDGFIFRVRPNGDAEVVASGLAGANGCCFDNKYSALYVAETGRARVMRFDRQSDGSLRNPQQFGPQLGDILVDQSVEAMIDLPASIRNSLGHPDNIAFDALGNLWVALPIANRIIAIKPDEEIVTIINDAGQTKVILPTSIGWGGNDLQDLYIGSLGTGHIMKARSPVPGLPLIGQ